MVFGWSDKDKHFIPTCFALVSNEDTECYVEVLNALKREGIVVTEALGDGHPGITAGKII